MISVTGGPTKVSCSLQRTLLFPPQLQALLSQAVLLPSGVRVLVAQLPDAPPPPLQALLSQVVLLPSGVRVLVAQLADVDPKAMQEAAVGLQV